MNGRLRAAWSDASPRERGLLVLAALVVAAAAAYALWLPLHRDLAAGDQALARIEARLATARLEADEIVGLARETRTPRTPDARTGAERVVDAQGLRGALTAIGGEKDRVRMTFATLDFAALAMLLDRLAQEEQLFPVEALLAAQVTPGVVRAELSLARPTPR